MHFFSFHNANLTYPFLYTTTNHSCCVLVPQLGGLGLLLAAGHCLPVHLRPPLLHTAFPRLLQVLQCASPQPFYRSPTTSPSFTTSTNFTAATTRLSVRPAARPHCREEARPVAHSGTIVTFNVSFQIKCFWFGLQPQRYVLRLSPWSHDVSGLFFWF